VSPEEGPETDPAVAEEYDLIRNSAAVIPLARDFVRISGPDSVSYLQGQCSQDVAALAVGSSAEALLLEPQGRVDAFVRVTKVSDDELVVDTDAGFGVQVINRLERFKLRVKVEISAIDWTCLSVRGPLAAGLVTDPRDLRVAVDWPGLPGFDLVGESPTLPEGVPRSGIGAWSAARIEAGIPVMGAEIDEKTIPAEAGLVERCVSFTKGCFTGQELVARLDSRGSNVARRLCGLVVEGTLVDGTSATAQLVDGAGLVVGEKNVGRVTSVAWSPGLGATVGLCYLHRSVAVPAVVSAGGRGELSVQVRALPLVG
jgi:tRNA-modifying protein YgfZ